MQLSIKVLVVASSSPSMSHTEHAYLASAAFKHVPCFRLLLLLLMLLLLLLLLLLVAVVQWSH